MVDHVRKQNYRVKQYFLRCEKSKELVAVVVQEHIVSTAQHAAKVARVVNNALTAHVVRAGKFLQDSRS